MIFPQIAEHFIKKGVEHKVASKAAHSAVKHVASQSNSNQQQNSRPPKPQKAKKQKHKRDTLDLEDFQEERAQLHKMRKQASRVD